MGGKAAMRFASVFPECVNRLVLVDITHKAHEPHYAGAIEALCRLDLGSLTRLKDAENRLKPDIPETGLRLFLLKNLRHTPDGKFRWRVNLEAIRRHYAALSGPVAVRPFSNPCLFIRGGTSNYVRNADWPEIKRFFPRAELATIAGAGHWLHMQDKEAFLRAVGAFMARHR
jgi:pimeloyl-ACP methyl ester carboxylesterase